MTNPDYSSILFDPEDIGILGSQYLEERKSAHGKGVKIGLASLDRVMYPAFPGELWTVIARPGHGKTGFMMRWARTRAAQLRDAGITDKMVLYISLEQSIEELNAFNVAAEKRLNITNLAMGEITDSEWNECLSYAINRRFPPLWNIGYSSMTSKKQIRINMQSIEGAVALALETMSIDIIFVDYLQRIPYDGHENKAVGVSDNLDALKTMAQRVAKCPVVVGAQAGRKVDEKPDGQQIPDMDDGQWTSNIEQSSDRVLSLVRPINYVREGETFYGKRVTGRNMLLVSVLKQKLAKSNFAVWTYFQPEYNKLDELELGAENEAEEKRRQTMRRPTDHVRAVAGQE